MPDLRSSQPQSTRRFDLVVTGGRVIDPESGLDDVRNIGITSGVITEISSDPLVGSEEIDAQGLVVAPGFIDLHSHGQGIAEHRLRALDGVTTALELEAGLSPASVAYAASETEGRPLNFGFSASWAAIRMSVLTESPLLSKLSDVLAGLGSMGWRGAATEAQTSEVLRLLERELEDGALGIGILLGYAPETDPREYVRIAQVAAEADVPTFTHARPLVEQDSNVLTDGAEEIARVAAETGAHMHYCHINATSNSYLDRAWSVIDRARSEGAHVTTEGYPYGAGMTSIGADYFDPSRFGVLGIEVTDLVYAPTGETVSGVPRLNELRAQDPGGLVFVNYYDESKNLMRLAQTVSFDGSAVASDAMLFVSMGGAFDERTWPLPSFVTTHPRSAGTYGRTFRVAVRETGALSLTEAIAKSSLYPAQIMERVAPGMLRKGRIQVGCDADLTIFDAERVTDLATYQAPTRASIGFRYVLVNGQPVVKNGDLQLDAMPGRAVRGSR